MKMKCIAIDDEPLALRQIKKYISQTSALELRALFSNAIDARDFLQTERVDLIFVDINMPDLSGLEFVRELNEKCAVIFTTAYAEYALEGFRLDAVDYLLKPFSLMEFQRAVMKANSIFELLEMARDRRPKTAEGDSEKSIAELLPDGPEYLSVKADYKTSLVRIAEIRYIESEGEYVRLHLADGSSIMTLFRLKNMESTLPPEQFMRIHRSYIINLKYISGYAKGRVYLSDEEYLPIGDNYRPTFLKFIDEQFKR